MEYKLNSRNILVKKVKIYRMCRCVRACVHVCTENSLKEVLKPVAFDLLERCFMLECILAGFGVPVPPRLGNIWECVRDGETLELQTCVHEHWHG